MVRPPARPSTGIRRGDAPDVACPGVQQRVTMPVAPGRAGVAVFVGRPHRRVPDTPRGNGHRDHPPPVSPPEHVGGLRLTGSRRTVRVTARALRSPVALLEIGYVRGARRQHLQDTPDVGVVGVASDEVSPPVAELQADRR